MAILPSLPYELQIVQWSNQSPNEELCGVLARSADGLQAYQIRNVAKDRSASFAMDEPAFLEAMRGGHVWGTWHVHPGPQDDDGPSLADMDRCNAWSLPGCILVRRRMRFRYYQPNGYKTPVYQRPYVPGIFDCFALVKDALSEYVGFELEDLDREQLDNDGCLPDVMGYWKSQGWELLLQPRPGRVAMIHSMTNGRCNHLGLIISAHELIHQLRGHLSRVEFLGHWSKWAIGYLSHPWIEQKVKAERWDRLPFNPADYEGPRTPTKAPSSPPQRVLARPSIRTAERPLDPQILKVLRGNNK